MSKRSSMLGTRPILPGISGHRTTAAMLCSAFSISTVCLWTWLAKVANAATACHKPRASAAVSLQSRRLHRTKLRICPSGWSISFTVSCLYMTCKLGSSCSITALIHSSLRGVMLSAHVHYCVQAASTFVVISQS